MITSIVVALYLMGMVSAPGAATFLFVMGALLIASEFLFWSGFIAANGVLALYVGYTMKYGHSMMFGLPVDWQVLFGLAAVEGIILAAVVYVIVVSRRHKPSTGAESMIGQPAEVIEWHGQKGRVLISGEIWKARTDRPADLKKGSEVTIESVEKLTLKIKI